MKKKEMRMGLLSPKQEVCFMTKNIIVCDLQGLGDFIEYEDSTVLLDKNYVNQWRASRE